MKDTMRLRRLVRDYYEQMYANKMKSGRNEQIPRNGQPPKTDSGRNGKYE